ncbi:MAG: GNAT family N-acetyltransferase [Gemmataceae bacterium]|nr:GNAT family N-acetyltransferase [Gemmataceae bacterium]MDW8266656.1 GNAT family N-acetyltransferase [Gemmataceae bacterium]
MQDKPTVEIRLGLPSELRRPAVALYYEAFRAKFAPLMTLDEALRILADLLNTEQAIIALDNGRLVGFAGIQHGKRMLFRLSLSPFVKTLGFFRGLFVYLVLSLFGRPYKKGELLMDGICVDKEMRGQGIGGLLLKAIFDFARQHNYKTIRLDVVDTNPGARRLYERMGFKPTVERRHLFAQTLMGFSRSTTMIKVLESPEK